MDEPARSFRVLRRFEPTKLKCFVAVVAVALAAPAAGVAVALAAPAAGFDSVAAAAPAGVPFESVGVGGGGFTSGVVVAPRSAAGGPAVYTRTDVGGLYRLRNDSGALSWLPLTDGFTFSERNWYGGEALAVSALDARRVFAALGAYYAPADTEPAQVGAGVFASADGGASWRLVSPRGWRVRAGGNDSPLRGRGERLAVHPRDENVLLYGSALDGLWRTGDAGAAAPAWARVDCAVGGAPPCDAPAGALALLFDASSPGGDTVYASFWGVGVAASRDAGKTWSLLPGAPSSAGRLALALVYGGGAFADGSAPAAAAGGDAPYSSSSGLARGSSSSAPAAVLPAPPDAPTALFAAAADGVWALRGGAWARVVDGAAACVDVSPFDAADVLALRDASGGGAVGFVRSRDGGATWSNVSWRHVSDYAISWWNASFDWDGVPVDFQWSGYNAKFGAHAPGALFLGDFWNMWLSNNFGATALPEPVPPAAPLARWEQLAHGHEEVFVLALAGPHAGPPLVMGTADLGGFVFQGGAPLSEYPPFSFFGRPVPEEGIANQWGAEGTGVAYTEATVPDPAAGGGSAVPALILHAQARAFPGMPDVKRSADGGRTWLATPSLNATLGPAAEPLGVAVAAWPPPGPAGAPPVMVVLVANSTPWASADGGLTWARAGAPAPAAPFPAHGYSGNRYNMSKPLAADRPTTAPGRPGFFLLADCVSGGVLTSADGVVWAPRGAFPPSPRCVLEPAPTPAGGAFWLALDKSGLYKTVDGGVTLTRVIGVQRAYALAVGAPLRPGGEPVVFVFGSLEGTKPEDDLGVVASADAGATWVPVPSSNGKGLGNWPAAMAAPRQAPGVVVVGSFGRGAFFANATALLLA